MIWKAYDCCLEVGAYETKSQHIFHGSFKEEKSKLKLGLGGLGAHGPRGFLKLFAPFNFNW